MAINNIVVVVTSILAPCKIRSITVLTFFMYGLICLNVPFCGVVAIDATHWIALWNVANDNADNNVTTGARRAATVRFDANKNES